MTQVQATLNQPIDDARTAMRSAAAEQGYALVEGESGPGLLVFTKGASAFSWGSHIAVELEESDASATRLNVTTGETWALTDWGRGGRAARKLLDAVGAEH